MSKNVPDASTSSTKDRKTKDPAHSESVTESHMVGTSATDSQPDPNVLTPEQAAILDMDTQLLAGIRLIREIKNMTAQLETAFKLMTFELGVIAKANKVDLTNKKEH